MHPCLSSRILFADLSSVRASMANTAFFKSYTDPTTNSTFLLHGSHHPSLFDVAISEQKRTFSSRVLAHPDILLSLGSGHEPERHDTSQSSPTKHKQKNSGNAKTTPHKSWQNILDSSALDTPLDRFVRIDPAITHLPESDDLHNLEFLQSMTKSYFNMEEIRKIALRLFAKLFYFEEIERSDDILDDEFVLQGKSSPTINDFQVH